MKIVRCSQHFLPCAAVLMACAVKPGVDPATSVSSPVTASDLAPDATTETSDGAEWWREEPEVFAEGPESTVTVASSAATGKAILQGLLLGEIHSQRDLDAGVVAVQWDPDAANLTIIDDCPVKGKYDYVPTTFAFDRYEFRSLAELRVRAPLLVATLGADVEHHKYVSLFLGVRGVHLLENRDIAVPETPSCKDVTHVVSAVSVGAYYSIAGEGGGGGISTAVLNLQASLGGEGEASMGHIAGDPVACQESSPKPIAECSSPLQVSLRRIRSDNCTAAPSGNDLFLAGSSILLGSCSRLKAGQVKVFFSGRVEGKSIQKPTSKRIAPTVDIAVHVGGRRVVDAQGLDADIPINSALEFGQVHKSENDQVAVFVTLHCGDDMCRVSDDFAVKLNRI